MNKTLVLVVPGFPKLSETFIVNKAYRLLRAGIDLHIACDSIETDEWKFFPGIDPGEIFKNRIHKIWPHSGVFISFLFFPAAFIFCLLKAPLHTAGYFLKGFRQKGIKIVKTFYLDAHIIPVKPRLIHFEFGALAGARIHLKELLNCKIVTSFRGYDLNCCGLEDAGYYRSVWDSSDLIHLLGKDLWHKARLRGCSSQKTHILIPPCIDADFFKPSPGECPPVSCSRPLRILSVGRMDWRKGYEYGMQAVKILTERNVPCQWKIIGDGEYFESTAFARHQLGLEKIVELPGGQSRHEVKKQLQWADVFLHSAVSEGFCNAVLEAQAMELPVVCADGGGLPENVEHEVTGIVVPRRNPPALAGAIERLSEDAGLRMKMGRGGRERVLKNFQLDKQINMFRDMYENVLNTK